MSDATVENGYQIYRPTLAERVWTALGFHRSYCPGFDEVGTHGDPPRWAPGEVSTRTIIRLGWTDRVRALISGIIDVDQRMRTNVMVDEAETRSVAKVAWPGAYPKPKRPSQEGQS